MKTVTSYNILWTYLIFIIVKNVLLECVIHAIVYATNNNPSPISLYTVIEQIANIACDNTAYNFMIFKYNKYYKNKLLIHIYHFTILYQVHTNMQSELLMYPNISKGLLAQSSKFYWICTNLPWFFVKKFS